MVLTFVNIVCICIYTIPLVKLLILEKEKYTLHTIANLTIVCHMRVENLLKRTVLRDNFRTIYDTKHNSCYLDTR